MRTHDLSVLDRTTEEEIEIILDLHTSERIPVDRYTAFSWSATRHATFTACKRQYYLQYYGARRVREANNRIVSAVWWLKQVTPLNVWIGSIIHQMARAAVEAVQRGLPMSRDEVIDLAVNNYRQSVIASEREAKHQGQWVALFEHVYSDAPPSVHLDEAEGRVKVLAASVLDSDAYHMLLDTPPDLIYEVDPPFQSFNLPDVPKLGTVRVFAIPDVLLYDEDAGRVRIIDWKTGNVEREGIRTQAGIYTLYAHYEYGVPGEAVDFDVVALADGGKSVEPPGARLSVAEAEAFARQSMYDMIALMENVSSNSVRIKDFPKTADRSLCQWCGFRRVCGRDGIDDET